MQKENHIMREYIVAIDAVTRLIREELEPAHREELVSELKMLDSLRAYAQAELQKAESAGNENTKRRR